MSTTTIANKPVPTGLTQTPSDHRSDETLVGRWRLDPRRSTVEFSVRLFWGLVTVKGHFEEYQGRLDLSADPAIELTVDAASIQTGNRKRDEHLRSADFFDVEHYPRVQFESDLVELRGDSMRVRGRLSAHGRAIPVELDAQTRRLNGELAIEASTNAPHRELGMTWNRLRMIRPQSKLVVKACLIRSPDSAA
jgi:polyisoprenoid-binding protein YceI